MGRSRGSGWWVREEAQYDNRVKQAKSDRLREALGHGDWGQVDGVRDRAANLNGLRAGHLHP